jgi:hypothetical protein
MMINTGAVAGLIGECVKKRGAWLFMRSGNCTIIFRNGRHVLDANVGYGKGPFLKK